MTVELISHTPNPVYNVEQAASVCYKSEPSADGKIMKQCYQSGHQSVLEHSSFTFRIEGISRSCSHQLVRHRTAKFSQESQRYCSMGDNGYIIPDSIKRNATALAFYERGINETWKAYKTLQELGIPNEDARQILPNACHTTIVVTFDGRNLLHFMNERLCTCAQSEIRELALKMKQALDKEDDCKLFAEMCVPKCEAGKIKYCNESPKRSCGRQPLAKDIIQKLTTLNGSNVPTKEQFFSLMNTILSYLNDLDRFDTVFESFSDSNILCNLGLNLSDTLINYLEEAFGDTESYISWWIHTSEKKTVYIEEKDTTVDVEMLGDLYDFLVDYYRKG